MKAKEETLLKLIKFAGLFVEAVCVFRDERLKKWDAVPMYSTCLEIPLLENANITPSRLSNLSSPYANYCVTNESLIFFNEAEK